MSYVLGTAEKARFGDIELRVNDDVRKCVAFIGFTSKDANGATCFTPGGTAFFLSYQGVAYTVTAAHVAKAIQPPFVIRATNQNEESVSLEVLHAGWFYHPDKDVDVAAVVGVPKKCMSIDSTILLTDERVEETGIGIGDEAHIVGLYRLMYGEGKNLPIVHTGHIAMVPDAEKIPMRDRQTGKRRSVEGYLIEAQTLEGLSGSPVFARHTVGMRGTPPAYMAGEVSLLGIWLGAWDAPPGEVLSIDRPDAQRVPVGMGITAPAAKILELLDMPEVAEHRKRRLEKAREASQDAALPTTDGNPQGREDFNSLLDAAVSGLKPSPEKS